MADIETLGIIQDIESLVSDQLQVVSYKWLSRNYLLSSNSAKRLLQEFVEKHGSGLEVVYALSGWLKSDPRSYHIRLVAGPKLDEAKLEFNGSCSAQVYSVQSCIPKDPAMLWNAEFVQAEELFKQPSTVENCLRDNRYCAITSSFIKRTVEGNSSSASTLQVQSGIGLGPSKCSSTRKNVSVPQTAQQKGDQTSSKVNPKSPNEVKNEVKTESNGSGAQQPGSKPPTTSKEKPNSVPDKKKKVNNGKSSSGAEGSLANMWNRASAKSKASCPAETSIGASAEAQISAREAEDEEGVSSDNDDRDVNFKRASNGEGARKRRVVLDLSDEDVCDDAVNLSSPERVESGQYMEESIKSLAPKKYNPCDDKQADDKSIVNEKVFAEDKETMSKKDSPVIVSDRIKETSPKEKVPRSSVPENDADKNDAKPTSTLPKRRKVLKTRIDERGREVTEVVWEGEENEVKNANNGTTEKADSALMKKAENITSSSKDLNRQPVAAKKSPAMGNTVPSNPAAGKAGNKKTGNKDPKQGNILSFFKKV